MLRPYSCFQLLPLFSAHRQSARYRSRYDAGQIAGGRVRERLEKLHQIGALRVRQMQWLPDAPVQAREYGSDRGRITVITVPDVCGERGRIEPLQRRRHVVVVLHDGLQRGERAIVEIRRRELDVAQRRNPERELVELVVEELTAPFVERRALTHAGSELGDARIREVPSAQERPVVTCRAASIA